MVWSVEADVLVLGFDGLRALCRGVMKGGVELGWMGQDGLFIERGNCRYFI